MPPEDPAAGTHGQVLLLLHEGLQGKAADAGVGAHSGHQGLQQDGAVQPM